MNGINIGYTAEADIAACSVICPSTSEANEAQTDTSEPAPPVISVDIEPAPISAPAFDDEMMEVEKALLGDGAQQLRNGTLISNDQLSRLNSLAPPGLSLHSLGLIREKPAGVAISASSSMSEKENIPPVTYDPLPSLSD